MPRAASLKVQVEAMRTELIRMRPLINAAHALYRASIENNPLSVADALQAFDAARLAVHPGYARRDASFRAWVVSLALKVGPKAAATLAGIRPGTAKGWLRKARVREGSDPLPYLRRPKIPSAMPRNQRLTAIARVQR